LSRAAPGPDLAARSLTHLRRIYQAIHNASSAIESRTGITGPQLWALHAVVSAPEGLTLSQIAGRLVLHNANAGRLVDKLRLKKLVTVERPAHDRRFVIVRPTPQGKKILAKQSARPAQLELLVKLTRLKAARLETIEGVLAEIVRLLGAEKVEPGTIIESARGR
jgi:DNA-binding MarR family transcriptional regulator